jgi:hypothetical protein
MKPTHKEKPYEVLNSTHCYYCQQQTLTCLVGKSDKKKKVFLALTPSLVDSIETLVDNEVRSVGGSGRNSFANVSQRFFVDSSGIALKKQLAWSNTFIILEGRGNKEIS